jgi:hypothetical protein
MAAILEVDEVLVKPFDIATLTDLIHKRVLNRKPVKRLDKERVGAILLRCTDRVVERWLGRAKKAASSTIFGSPMRNATGILPNWWKTWPSA